MLRVTDRQLEEFVRRGMVKQSDVDDILKSRAASRKRTEAAQQRAVEATRFRLEEPVTIMVPMELWTENRLRAMQPIVRGRHIKKQRECVRNCWLLTLRHQTPELPVDVLMTRFGRRMDAHDSLMAAFKHVTDEITELLGLKNDDTPLISWNYGQQPRGSEPEKITIRIASRGE